MEILFLIAVILLFTAWIVGLIVAIPSIWRKYFGESNHRYPVRRGFPVKRRKAF